MQNQQQDTVQHREMQVQTTPLNRSFEKSPQQNQSQFGKDDQQQQNGNYKLSDDIGDQTVDTNLFEYKQYINPDTRNQSATTQLKKICSDCTTGSSIQKLKLQQLEVTKLKQQNDKLIASLRQMSAQLDETLEKFKVKKNEKPSLNYESAKQVNESELENAKQQLQMYQKQMDSYANQDQEYSSNRMNQWAQQIKEIDYQLTEAKREQERTMQSNKEGTKLKMLRDEVMHLKSLIREAKRVAKDNEKGFKKTQEHTEKLRMRHDEVCKQFGVPFAPYETLAKDERVEIKLEDKEEGKFYVLKINEENIFKLQSHLKILNDCIKTLKKQQKIDIKGSQKQSDDLQRDKQELIQQIEKREKEIVEAYDLLNNFKTLGSNSTANLNGLKVLSEGSKPGKSASLQVIAPYVKKYKPTKNNFKSSQLNNNNDKNQISSK